MEEAEIEHKKAEVLLQDREAFLSALVNAIPIPVFYKDKAGRYLGFNKAFEIFFGETRERLIGKSVFDVNPPELAEIYHAKDQELFMGEGIQRYESMVKNTNGELRNGRQYSYVLTEKGVNIATMFVLFHKRLFGPLANSLFHHRPNKLYVLNSKLEKAYHQADDYIKKITELLAA
ncbi:MAG: PAS domain S-box protein [Deltaproteobacteria bacterium]|nr:PAS domain S-box protein [Deltaproteobacteria bacterium]